MLTLRRLRREVAQVKTTDDWTVLGIPRSADLDLVERARQRMADRYARISTDENYSDEIHNMAREIASRVEEAAQRIKDRSARMAVHRATPPPPMDPVPEPDEYAADPATYADQLFLKGQAALASGDAVSAIRVLREARNEQLDSARNMAWLGWALYQETSRPLAERRKAAMELLELADQFDSEYPDGQFFLAAVEAEANMHKRASARLRRVLRARPEHMLARRLYDEVMAALKRQQQAEQP